MSLLDHIKESKEEQERRKEQESLAKKVSQKEKWQIIDEQMREIEGHSYHVFMGCDLDTPPVPERITKRIKRNLRRAPPEQPKIRWRKYGLLEEVHVSDFTFETKKIRTPGEYFGEDGVFLFYKGVRSSVPAQRFEYRNGKCYIPDWDITVPEALMDDLKLKVELYWDRYNI